MNTTNSVALVTGASRGLGLEVARAYAQRGLRLILTARGADELRAVEKELRGRTEVAALAGDVADKNHVAHLFARGLQQFGQIDVLINNASELGPSPMPPLADLELDSLRTILDVNVVAPLGLIQKVLPGMLERKRGLIVNVTSDAGVQAYPTWGGYGASKAALEHLSRVLAAEIDGSGVRVYVVDPGDMNTAMHQAAEPGVDLSHLPGPEVVAPAFIQLLDKPAPFGRFEAQRLVAASV
jgi:short-subunit dehydrogenase